MAGAAQQPGPAQPGPLRLGELLGSVSLATDLGTGQPLGHALRTCALAVALAEALGCGPEERRTVHQFTLLRFLGCTADAAETAVLVGGDERAYNAAMAPALHGSGREQLARHVRSVAPARPRLQRARLVARSLADPRAGARSLTTHCEVAAALARRIGLEQPVVDALAHAYERWDGKGFPAGLEGDAVPLAVRVAAVARDVDLATGAGEDPRELLRARRGRAYDPAVVDAFERAGRDIFARLVGEDEWEAMLAAEPKPVAAGRADAPDELLAAFADFADLKSPWLRGHSRSVSALAGEAGRLAGLGDAACTLLRRAGLAHSLGRVAVENGIWDRAGPLTTAEWERVRLHPYFTERILARCGPLAPSSRRRRRTTSASTGRATTARFPARRSPARHGFSPPRTCSPPSSPTGRTGRRSRPRTRRRRSRPRRVRDGSTWTRSPACSRRRAGARRPRRASGRRG
ncbi:MAG TPA: HD domain-containing phosphohydrolase [Gaiellaceae bacterium]|nr:HD domain-containing phosphohydrolase [Gaiellaceae bacterium]